MFPDIVIDAHEDIAWNMLTFGRDYMQGAHRLRGQEEHTPIPSHNGNALLGVQEWIAGRVAIIFATLFVSPAHRRVGEWDTQSYSDAQEASLLAGRQLDAYHRLADEHSRFQLISSRSNLESVLATWAEETPSEHHCIGLVPLMEGAEAVLEPAQVQDWYERGIRIIGPAWEATRYAGGTHEPGPLTPEGYDLLDRMASLDLILDLSHLAEEAFYQAADHYAGVLIASHSNPRRFLPTSRGLSDEMIALIASRGGVIGVVPYNAFLDPGWKEGDPKDSVGVDQVVDAIDHICQVTGSAEHVGLGSDFDGGFGLEHVPGEIDSVADLRALGPVLRGRGFDAAQVSNILYGNWLRILEQALPE